jgi:non-specific serine/threonine protein kinase/serine/threonine-protein kinase
MSTPEPGQRSIFLRALDLTSTPERAAYLDEACGDDRQLRADVEALLRAHDRPQALLDAPDALPTAAAGPTAERPRAAVGPYKLLERVGEGGMGEVWVADQLEPIRRRVALKLIKAGMDSRAVLARFEAERQALALMDHPNIAKVHDAGTTDDGHPYFVMELVKGTPITTFCDARTLSPRERLELFVPVCQAVQHAHQKGVIHRDIKPGNVLVAVHDEKPVPKVIDFGVAKSVGRPLTEATLYTGFGALVGTPAYMAPEQATFNQPDVDTRADVYALGVLLYELLAGSPPLEPERLKGMALDEVLRLVREEESPRPSQRLRTSEARAPATAVRPRDPLRLARLVLGELDWIVMKALEKDRTRRYDTASGLAADVRRYLAGESVQAVPPSAGYRVRKFVRRNKGPVLTGVLVLWTLVAGIAVSTWLAVRATRAETQAAADRDRATDEAASAEAMLDFVEGDLLSQANPLSHAIPEPDLRMRTVLDRAAARIEGRFPDRPLAEARIRYALASAYWQLGEFSTSGVHRKRAYKLYLRNVGPEDERTLIQMVRLAQFYGGVGQNATAEKLLTDGLEISRRALGDDNGTTLHFTLHLVDLRIRLGQFDDAERLLKPALELSGTKRGPDDLVTLNLGRRLGELDLVRGKVNDAEREFARLIEANTRTLGPLHAETLYLTAQRGRCFILLRRYAEAEDLFTRLLDDYRNTLGPGHVLTVDAELDLAYVYVHRGKSHEAERLLEAALESGRRILVSKNVEPYVMTRTLEAMFRLGYAYHQRGEYSRAEPLLIEASKGYEQVLGPGSVAAIAARAWLARNLFKQGQYDKAEPLLVEAVKLCDLRRDAKDYLTMTAHAFLGWNRIRQGLFAEAEPMLRASLALSKQVAPGTFEHYANRALLGASLAGQGKFDEAAPLLVTGYDGMKQRARQIPPQEHFFGEAAGWLVELYEATGNEPKAAAWRAERARHQQVPAPPQTAKQ